MFYSEVYNIQRSHGQINYRTGNDNASLISGAVPGKAGKATALPQFCKIESGGGSGGAPPYWWSNLARGRSPRCLYCGTHN